MVRPAFQSRTPLKLKCSDIELNPILDSHAAPTPRSLDGVQSRQKDARETVEPNDLNRAWIYEDRDF